MFVKELSNLVELLLDCSFSRLNQLFLLLFIREVGQPGILDFFGPRILFRLKQVEQIDIQKLPFEVLLLLFDLSLKLIHTAPVSLNSTQTAQKAFI